MSGSEPDDLGSSPSPPAKFMSDKTILAIQVGGFAAAVVILPFMHGGAQILFSLAFAVHFVGDIFRLRKDGVI